VEQLPNPYDRIAGEFAKARAGFREQGYVDRLIGLAAPGARILDLGCGTGIPIARYLIDHGFRVTGIDSSAAMLALARRHCPEADLILADMAELELDGPFGGIVAWDSVFHVPRARHGRVFAEMARMLTPGAPLLLSVGGSEGDFTAPMFEVEFSYSGDHPEESRPRLGACGFEIRFAEVDDPTSRGHVAMLCARAH
jgi:SAM-dependent methyltransferase